MTMNKLEKFTIKKLGPLRLSALLNRIERLVAKYRNYSARSLLEAKRDIAVATLPELHRHVATMILNNQINQILESVNPDGAKQSQHLTFNTAIHTIKAYQLLSNIVSVQPMTKPVDIVYKLQYEPKDDDNISLGISSQALEASSKRYSSKMGLSAVEDSKFYNLNVEDEFAKALGSEFACEIVNDTIGALCRIASKHDNVEANASSKLGAICELNRASAGIAYDTRRGAGNVLVMNPVTSYTLTELYGDNWTPSTEPETLSECGITYAGKLYKYDVYVNCNPELTDYKVLVAYLGRTKTVDGKPSNIALDAGYIAAPYIPVVPVGIVVNNETFEPELRYMCRSGAVLNDSYHYGKGTIFHGKNYYRMVDLSKFLDTEK